MAMEMRLEVWVEDPEDPEQRKSATLIVHDLEINPDDYVLEMRFQLVEEGDVAHDPFDIDLDALRTLFNAFEAREATVVSRAGKGSLVVKKAQDRLNKAPR